MFKTFYPEWSRRTSIILSLVIFFFITLVLWNSHNFLLHKETSAPQEKVTLQQPWMTIFINGSFGSLMGFLNFTDVLYDNVSGTLYRKTVKKMRDDTFFFRDQPILQRGLIAVQPTFDLNDVQGKKYAIYPIAKAYQEISDAICPGKEKNYFYTFGWSGLVSQKSRRFESIRFYNALTEEIARLHGKGIYPKIRLIAHSHGGNVCLNLAAVRNALAFVSYEDDRTFSENPHENESLKKMAETLKTLGSKEQAKGNVDQKVYDYVPITTDLVIDELLMMGTPIQPETECFCFSDFFKKVYNLYSDGDIVQRIDWVTSKKPLSAQRFTSDSPAHIVQARLMAEKAVSNGFVQAADPAYQKSISPTQEVTVLDELLSGRNLFVRESKDPTHKELWFISWKDEAPVFRSFISPLPVVVLLPLLLHAIATVPYAKDIDINLDVVGDNVTVYVTNYQEKVIRGTVQIPLKCIQDIQEKIQPWKPDDISQAADFQAAYKHIE